MPRVSSPSPSSSRLLPHCVRRGSALLRLARSTDTLASFAVKWATPPFGRYAAEEQRLEGEYRFSHTRLLEHAEEIALLRGSETEKNIIERTYYALIRHVNRVFRMRMAYSLVEEGIVKWVWGSLGLCVCAVPVFGMRLLGMSAGAGGGIDFGSRTEGAFAVDSSLVGRADVLAPQDLSRTDACCFPRPTLSAYVLVYTRASERTR